MPTSLQSVLKSVLAGLVLAAAVIMPALADGLKDEIAPTGKLRVAIAISPAGGGFWSSTTDAASKGALEKGAWDVTWLPKDPERETRMMFGPIYEVADATYIVKAGSN